ncbi:phospholipase DDHD2-like isoform X2 [Dreissena polymorpha]|uniref:phospholipase DDHD2-like isoform X2 n=1 Tax=Dreissena polymorpha TaxID=45954 RepID=UPI0022651615|nr:phospholipase DDHD2-like isoform X2 [Dreissena polymorpha]
MADKFKKDATPPPLLLMPAGGGLTLTPPDQPSLFMPVVQSEPSLFGPEDDVLGEADSFVGQSPPQSTTGGQYGVPQGIPPPGPPPSALFQSTLSNSGPFVQGLQGSTGRPSPGSTPPLSQAPTHPSMPSHGLGVGMTPLVPSGHVPASTHMSAASPMPNSSGLQGLYRKHGSSRYAQMPAGTYAGSGSSPAALMSAPPAPVPFSQNFLEASGFDLAASVQTSGQGYGSGLPQTLPAQPSLGPMQGMGYVPSAIGTYLPVANHWCYCANVEGRDIWYPLSMADNLALEEALKSGDCNIVVPIEGGRYDVNLSERKRYPVYWEEEPKAVRRCSWFYKREGDNRYVPYDENLCNRLEDEYRTAVTSGVWHKPIQFETGETIVMHNTNVMVHYQPSSQPDEWGTTQVSQINPSKGDQMRPRVVKRGVSDFDITEGESRQVDHLVFVVHGIGTVCDIRFRNIVECVDDFRSISQSLLSSHFSEYVTSNRIGRVEYLPIQWHVAVHGDATGIDKRLKEITLPSTQKLRHFVNDTLLDVLFYTSPKYCQCIADTVGREINRLHELFMARNPHFRGGISVAGHSLGSCILFDLLQHQGDQSDFSNDTPMTNGKIEQESSVVQEPMALEESFHQDQEEEEESTMTLESLLAKVGLQEKAQLFEAEQIDLESLSMCSDSDLKDLGLPMGPRKKLQGLLTEQIHNKEKKKQVVEQRKRAEEDRKIRERVAMEMALKQQQQKQSNNASGSPSNVSVDYIVGLGGTGQPHIKYPQLQFSPVCCFALGSPVGLFLSARGLETIGEEFRLPTCQKYFNIFHPFDPVAYRLEPLINPSVSNIKPVLMPHHKGRKRLHLELKESLARMGTDIKQKIIDSLKSTWMSLNNFARAHSSDGTSAGVGGESLEQQVEAEMSHVAQQLEDDDRSSVTSNVEDIYIGQLNEGRRVDYVLQERPIESFNDYMFSLTSHGCYWNSEDTVLLVLKEIYAIFGIAPKIPGAELGMQKPRVGPPPKGPPPAIGSPYGAPSAPSAPIGAPSMSTIPGPMMGVNFGGNVNTNNTNTTPHMYGASSIPFGRPPQMPVSSNLPPLSGPPPFNGGSARNVPAGPPPMAGFVKKS